MRELTYYVACSVDGFIAQTNGSHDGFSQDKEYFLDIFSTFPETVPTHLRNAMNIHGENKQFDTVLMGRRTYEIGLKENVTSPYTHLKQYLFSRSMTNSPNENVELVSEDAIERIAALKKEAGRGIWLCGGGNLATELFNSGLVDQLILKINPFLMGAGISLFAEVIQQTALELTHHKVYDNGVLLTYYRVNPS